MTSGTHIDRGGVNWRVLPLFRLSIPFVIGIVGYAPGRMGVIAIAAGVLLLAMFRLGALLGTRSRVIITYWAAGLALGITTHWCADYRNDPGWIAKREVAEAYLGLVKNAAPYSRGTRATLVLRYAITGDTIRRMSGKVLAYLQHDADQTAPAPRDTLVFRNPPATIPAVGNPFQWNPAKYYGDQQIHHHLFANPDTYSVHMSAGIHVGRTCHDLRRDMQTTLRGLMKDTSALAVLNAMLLGDRSLVAHDLRNAYVRSGLVHILAISGLHIGIVATILILLFGRPKAGQSAPLRLVRCLLILAGIWGFTLVSGMSPSALRAALMCSVATIGLTWNRRSHPLNILGCTAIAVLIMEPTTVYSISFQFSFLALLGILVFARPVFHLVAVRNRLLRYIWGIISVSIAAQVPIAPAMLYYFGQMSTLSPLTSIVGIPAAFLIVTCGIALMALAPFAPGVAQALAGPLTAIIRFLNSFASCLGDMRGSFLAIEIPPEVLICLYALVGCLVLRALYGDRRWTYAACLPACLAAILYISHLASVLATPAMAIFPSTKPYIEVYSRGYCHSTASLEDLSRYEQGAVQSARRMHLIAQATNDSCQAGMDLRSVLLPETHLYILPSDLRQPLPLHGQQWCLYIVDKPDENILVDWLAAGPRQVIANGRLWSSERQRIAVQCADLGIPFYDMRTSGAYYTHLR